MRRTRVRSALLCMLAASLLAVAACGSDDNDSSSAGSSGTTTKKAASSGSGKSYTIGYVPACGTCPFSKPLETAMKLQAAKLGMKLEIAGGVYDPSKYRAAVDSLIDRGVDALALEPLDAKALQPSLERAKSKNIPVITFATKGVPNVTADISPPEVDGATALANYAAKKIGKPCNVLIMEGLKVVPILANRNQGLHAGAKASGCNVLDAQVEDKGTAANATSIADAWKTKFGSKATGIFAYNDPAAVGSAATVDGDFKPLIIGMNGDPDAIKQIADGRILATSAEPYPLVGNSLVYAAHQALEGKDVPHDLVAPMTIVTKGNANDYLAKYNAALKSALDVQFVQEGDKWIAKAAGQ